MNQAAHKPAANVGDRNVVSSHTDASADTSDGKTNIAMVQNIPVPFKEAERLMDNVAEWR